MRYHKIPDETVRRLPLYLRATLELVHQGADRVSSQRLADHLGLTPWLIRKDLSYFGDLGTRGVGYNTEALVRRIKKILRLDVTRNAVLVGAGRLGSALLEYGGFRRYGLQIVAAFDRDRARIGRTDWRRAHRTCQQACDGGGSRHRHGNYRGARGVRAGDRRYDREGGYSGNSLLLAEAHRRAQEGEGHHHRHCHGPGSSALLPVRQSKVTVRNAEIIYYKREAICG